MESSICPIVQTLNKHSNAYVQTILYILENNTIGSWFSKQGLYCHELIFHKWVNFQKPRYWSES